MADDLTDLKAKLRARKGKPGLAENVAEPERIIEEAESGGYIYREAAGGRFVTAEYAAAHPGTTIRQKVGG